MGLADMVSRRIEPDELDRHFSRYLQERGLAPDDAFVPGGQWMGDLRLADGIESLAAALDEVRPGCEPGTVFFTTNQLRLLAKRIRESA